VKESRLAWHLDWLEKEKNWEVLGRLVGHVGENKMIWPKTIFRVKTFLFSKLVFQFTNYFEFKSDLNFERLLLTI
jgi:hypothetical protein